MRPEILGYVRLKDVRHLTYPAVWTAVTSHFAATVRSVAARTTDVTAGLALAVPGSSGQFEFLSVYVLPMFRRTGFGSSMLDAIEGEFRGLGFRLGSFPVRPRSQAGRRMLFREERLDPTHGQQIGLPHHRAAHV
ncbi:GNAT family N-acetyltransferase [Mesorhizobium sp. M1050]|uniref:GNAT family N-acetyltransferase n=1 Tax=Mesorhizobium sp. M1050 TaxID=2957051 RepID=UPI003336842C